MYVEEGYTKAMMQFVKLAAKWGAKPIKTKGKHLKFRDALGHQISAPKTSSDFRAIKNFKSELKNRGFVEQLPQSKVAKDKVAPTVSTTTVPTRRTAEQPSSFKDFMNKIRPILTDVKRPETTASRYERGWRKAIKELPASEKFRMGDDIIRQLRREEYIDEALIPSLIKGVARQVFKNKALVNKVRNTLPSTRITLPRTTTGFQTARGSKYTFSRKPDTWGKTQRTAVNDPTHPTPAGVKQKSDWTLFTTPDAAFDMKMRWREGASRKDFYKGLPLSPNPKKGRAAVEVWNQYQGKGRAIHNSNVITDLQTQGRKNTLPLYGQQRREIQQRVRAALGKEQNRNVLRREVRQGNDASLTNIYRNVRQNPQNPNTLENELRGRYRGKGVGRKETTTEQLAPIEKENQMPGKFSKIVVTTDTPADRMKSLKKRVGRYGKYLQKMSDIYPNYP